MLSKIFGVLFSGTAQAIEAIKIGQTDLKKQIKAAVNIIEGIQATHVDQSDNCKILQLQINKIKQEIKIPQVQRADFDTVLNSLNSTKLEIERLQAIKAQFEAVPSFESVSELKTSAECTGQSIDLIWAEIDTIKNTHAIELGLLKSEIEAIKAQPQPQPEVIPAEIEAQPESSKATAKARTMPQPRVKAVKQVNNAGILPWSEFQAVLKRALKITPKRGVIPVLNTVKIEFKGNDTAIITATDLDSYYSATLESNHFHSLSGQSILINRDQADKLSKARGMVVFLSGTDRNEPQDKAYTVKTDNFKDYIYSLPPEDYPIAPKMSGSAILTSESGLIPALLKSRSSQATDTAKSILTGTVLVRESADKIAIAATDGYKLFVDELSVNCGANDWDEMILSPQLCTFLGEFKAHNNISFFRDHDFIRVELTTGEMIHSKLLCGKYPAFRKILPKQFNHTLTVKRADLLAIVTEAKPFVNKQTQIISFQINHSDITATVDQVTTEIDQTATDAKHEQYSAWRRNKVAVYKTNTVYTNRLDCDLHTSEVPEKISFNRSYLEAALKGFDCETITICLNSEIQPVVITEYKYDDRQSMIMPIKP